MFSVFFFKLGIGVYAGYALTNLRHVDGNVESLTKKTKGKLTWELHLQIKLVDL